MVAHPIGQHGMAGIATGQDGSPAGALEPPPRDTNAVRGALGGQVDFFISRRGAQAAAAQEVAAVLTEAGYGVLVQDYDIQRGTNFVAAMHDALKRCRHLIVLLTPDYDASEFTLPATPSQRPEASRASKTDVCAPFKA
jgi:hypothetical protein